MNNKLLSLLAILASLVAGCTSVQYGSWDGTGWDNALVNCHTHTDHSIDGEWTLDEAMTWHQEQDFDAVYITDHLSSYNPLPWICQTPAMNRWNEAHPECLALPGLEWTTLRVHMLFLNVELWRWYVPAIPTEDDLRDAIENCHNMGGIALMAHPSSTPLPADGWPGSEMCETVVDPFTWDEVKLLGADGIEGWNGGCEMFFAPEIANSTGMIITTGTDAHHAWNEGWSDRFEMQYTRLTVRAENGEDIMDALESNQIEIYPGE